MSQARTTIDNDLAAEVAELTVKTLVEYLRTRKCTIRQRPLDSLQDTIYWMLICEARD